MYSDSQQPLAYAARDPWHVKVLLLLFGFVAAACLAEIVLRTIIGLQLIEFGRDPKNDVIHRYSKSFDLVYELKPNASAYESGVKVQTNSLAMRNREVSVDKAEKTFRIAVIGDSVAFGMGVPREATFSEKLQALLQKRTDLKVEVLNLGVIGYNSAQERIVLRERALALNPDLIVVAFCMNDYTITDGLGILSRQLHPHAMGQRLGSRLISFTLDQLERLGVRWLRSYEETKRLLEELALAGRNRGIAVHLVIFPFRFSRLEAYEELPFHAHVAHIAARAGIPVSDFLDVTRSMSRDEQWILYRGNDHIHFSKLDMEKVAEWLSKILEKERFHKTEIFADLPSPATPDSISF